MKRLIVVAILIWGSGSCLAQDIKQEIQGVYFRIQGFNYNSGGGDYAVFNVDSAAINGGGYAFVYHITDKFGLFQQMGFFGGPTSNGYKLKLITEFQGMEITKKYDRFDLYAKGGIGFTRYIFTGNYVFSNLALLYTGGIKIPVKEGLALVFEGGRITQGLPRLDYYEYDDRTKWDHSWHLSTGIAIQF
jgi:hypothetical protein